LQFQTKIFRAADGRAPFRDWLLGLDPFFAEKVVRSVERMENENSAIQNQLAVGFGNAEFMWDPVCGFITAGMGKM
jgi:hypothetical protein